MSTAIKTVLKYCTSFDGNVSAKIFYHQNLFHKTIKNELESFRFARRLLSRGSLIMAFKSYDSDKNASQASECTK